MKKLLTFFLTALLASAVGWAATATFTVNTYNTGTLEGAPSGVTASVSTDASQMGNGGSQLISDKHFTLTLSGFTSDYKVTGITLNYCTNASSGTGTFTATLGSNELGSYSITKVSGNGRTPRDAVLNISETAFDGSNLVLNVTATANSVYVIKFTITYSDNGSTPAEPNWYRKVTSTSSLVAGKKYIIVNEANGVGMGALNTNRYGVGVTGLTFDNGRVNIGGTDVMEMILGGSSNAWTFRMGENGNYLSNSSSSTNTFFSASSVNSSATDITKWTITPSADACAIQSNYVTAQYIRYNSSGVFGTYGINSQSAVALYVEDDGSTPADACADPEFNPDGGFFTGSASVTITSATEGATIYYTTDGTDPVANRSSIANGGTVELTENCTLKAMAVKSGMENSNIVTSQAYTINPAGGGGSGPFTLVTDVTTLEAGDEIIFVSSGEVGSADAMSTTQNNNNRAATAVDVVAGPKVAATSETQIFTLQGASTGWYFYTGSGYIYAQSSSSNNLRTEEVADDNAKAIISISSDGAATVVFQGTNTRNNLRYNPNSGNPIFSCYASTATQAKPFIYRRSGTPSTEPELTISPATQTISDAAPASLTITGENVSGSINASLANNNDWYLNPNTFSNTGGTATLTYTGRALSASNTVTASANGATSVSATVNYVADLYIVTDNGLTGNWNFNSGTQMTNNNGVYTATFTASNPNTYILFAKKLGDGVNWNTRYVFGPDSNGDWEWGTYTGGNIDVNDDDPIKLPEAGIYTVTIDANAGTFTITKQNINVTITPADGTHFTGSTISGTITSDPAGTIEWSTDGNNWQTYTDGFTATVNQVGGSVTVYARSTYNGVPSGVVSATYTRDLAPAPEAPSFSIGSSAVAVGTPITITAPEGCTLYVDGQQVTNPYDVTITHGTTISAYCVNDEGTHSTTVTNTYTIAAVCNAIIEFKDNGSDATSATTWNAIGGTGDNDYFVAGKDYLDGASDIERVYKGATGLKFGNSSNGGTITFTLDSEMEWKVSHITLNAKSYNGNNVTFTVETNNGQSETTSAIGSNLGGYTLDFNGSAITSITISSSARAYLKGFTITYDCAPEVEAPVITPATGTYYEDQTVTITGDSGTTIHYTTDGSEPTIDSPVYSGPFTAEYVANGTTTINAIAFDDQDNPSTVTEVTYTWGSPFVHIHPDSRNTTASSVTVTLTGPPASAQVYYTTDGSTPTTSSTLYNGPFTVALNEIGDQVTVNAIAVYGNLTSTMASATYTRVDHLVEVNAPFFSPLQNHTYYGDQTLLIGCTTPNADIYYEIVEVSGTTAPDAASVEDPTHASTYYDGTPIPMTVGNSYYVKAIAYIGNYVSTISEGWYTVVAAPTTQYTYANLKDFNDNCPTNVTAHFLNPVQVVYHSTYTNNGQFAEFCYLRDNTDYACVYFGKRDNSGKTIFEMGDWIDGSQIAGVTNVWDRNFHIQLGTQNHEVTSWPTTTLGWSEIIPEEMTNDVIVAGTADGDNVWGHYVHLRNTTLSNVQDYTENDPKHTGLINDGTADAYYYDKFYRWSAGTCTYSGHEDVIHHLGDYDQAFFTAKQNAGATFDVYGIVDYYSQYNPPFEICPIDFLWAYNPVMTPATTTSYEPVTVNITATQPEWAADGVIIYYKTDDMEEWAVYTGPITVNSTTTVQAYAEVPSEKLDGTNYNDFVRSEIVSETYTIEGIEDPTISPASEVIEIVTGEESVTVTVTDHNEAGSSAVTTYTVNGVEYTLEAGQSVEIVVTETTTVTAVSSIVSGEHTLYSSEVSETYTFVKKNGVVYDLLKTAPRVGNVYVIVNKKAYMGMSTTQNATNRGSVGVMFVENTNKEKVYGNDELAQFVLEKANADRYYFRNVNGDAAGYLVVMSNNFANLSTSAEATSYAEATVAVGGPDAADVDKSYPATVAFSYDGALRTLRYYANGRTFSTYGDASLNEDVFLYGVEATPLAYIEANNKAGDQVTVSDQLIGTWAVNAEINGETVKYLWAKDQGNVSIDKRPAKTQGQMDYVKDILKYQQGVEWDESNWVILDFAEVNADPDDFVGHKIESATVVGTYTNSENYTITLLESPVLVNDDPYTMDVPGYPGWTGPFPSSQLGTAYSWDYNSYVPANFMTENHNRMEEGKVVGFVAGDGALPGLVGDSLYFINPKIQEVAHLWAVWSVTGDGDIFTVYETEHKENENINAWNLNGTFLVDWTYNRLSEIAYGRPSDLTDNMAYEFHAAVMRRTHAGNGRAVEPQGTADPGTPSADYMLYPLDMSDSGTPTAVVEISTSRTIVAVNYYNLMGQESKTPFEGINIVVTRYSDGSLSARKVMR